MNQPDGETTSADTRPDPDAPRQSDPGTGPTNPLGKIAAWSLSLSLLFGTGAWLLGEALLHTFRPPTRMVSVMGTMMDMPTFPDRVDAERKNATLAYAVCGGMLGLGAGLAGGLARRSTPRALAASALGATLGMASGGLSAVAVLPVYFQRQADAQEELSRELMTPLIVHAGFGLAVGAAAGAALAIGLGESRKIAPAAVGGLMGGALGAFLYEVLAASLFPDGRTTQPLAEFWGARLVFYLSLAAMIGLVAAVGAGSQSRRPASARTRP